MADPNQTLDARRTAREQQQTGEHLAQMLAMNASIWQPLLHLQSVMLHTIADGFFAMAQNLEGNIRSHPPRNTGL